MDGLSVLKNKPEIRFAGFDEAWGRKRLGSIAKTTIGEFVIKTKQNDSYPYPVYNGGSSYTGYYDEFNNEGNKIVVSARGSAGFVNIVKTRYWAGNSCYSVDLLDKSQYDTDFIYQEMKHNQSRFVENQQTATIPAVSKTDVERFAVDVPSYGEQVKIAECFNNLDAIIILQQRKCDRLQALKKAMLVKMFPKEGSSIPEIRFAGFADAWEQRKLGEIAKTTIGEFVIKSKQDDSYPYPVFNGGSSNTGYYKEFNNEGNKILVSARGANAGFVNIIKTRYWAGNSCYSVDLLDKNIFDTDFIFQEMKHKQTKFTDNQQAANIPSVSKSDVEKFIVDVPSYSEQVKIGTYFKNLDNLITLHQRKLQKLQECKKALLEKMFVEGES